MDAAKANYYAWRSSALDEESSAALKTVLEGRGKYLACERGKLVVKEQGIWRKILALFHSSYALVSWAAQDLLNAKMQDKTPHTNKWIIMDQALMDQFGGEKIGGIIGKVFGKAEHPQRISIEKGFKSDKSIFVDPLSISNEITLEDLVEGGVDLPEIVHRGFLTVEDAIEKFLPDALPTDLAGLLVELEKRKCMPNHCYQQSFTEVRDQLFKGQEWGEKGPFEEPSGILLRDICRNTYGMKGEKSLHYAGPGEPEKKVQEFKEECLKRNPKLTEQQLNLIGELMSQTPLADVTMDLELLTTELMARNYLLLMSERTIEVDVQKDKVVVEVNFEPGVRNMRNGELEQIQFKVKATFTLNLKAPLQEGPTDVLEVKIESGL